MIKNNLKNKIMRRVYLIWFSRRVLPYLTAEVAVFVIFLYFISQQVYVARVLEYATSILASNMAHPSVFASFAVDLFIRTRVGVQISMIGSLAAMIFLFRNLINSALQLALTRETKPEAEML